MFYCPRMTCRHFRYQVPRECADELRDADPEPCPVCDILPHRKALAVKMAVKRVVEPVSEIAMTPSWTARLFGRREEIISALTDPVRTAA